MALKYIRMYSRLVIRSSFLAKWLEERVSMQSIIKLLQRFGPGGPSCIARHSVQNRQMQVLTVVLKYKTGRLRFEESIVTGVHRSGVRHHGVRHHG